MSGWVRDGRLTFRIDSLPSAKQDRHYKCMGKADLHSVNEPIPSTFENGKVVVVGWVRDNFVQECHRHLERNEKKRSEF